MEISETTRDVFTTLENNFKKTQCENIASLLKILPRLRYLARQELPFRRHANNKDSNFEQLLCFCCEDDPQFAEWLKKRIKSVFPRKFKMRC